MPTRNCRFVPLRQQPLVLVLAQVRFSPVRRLVDYLPAIQDDFRRHGFPIERSGKVQHLTITPTGAQIVEQDRHEYRTRDEQWSVTVQEDSVVLQTTAYEQFEGFADRLNRAVRTVLDRTEQSQFGLIERIGLRYIDLVQPRQGEDYRSYLRPGFHGVADAVFAPGSHGLHIENVGLAPIGDGLGTLVIRVMQNDKGFDLPPDLVGAAPRHTSRAQAGELVTLIDMDHYIEGRFDPDVDWTVARAFELHDRLIETFHDHVASEHAIGVWQ